MLDDARVSRGNSITHARPDLDRRLERQGEHQLLLHPQRRVAALQPRQAVPRRAHRDLGRRDGSTSTATTSTCARRSSPGRARPPRRRHRTGPALHRQLADRPAVHPEVDQPARATATIDRHASRAPIIPLQCLLKQQRLYQYEVTGRWNPQTLSGAARLPDAGRAPGAHRTRSERLDGAADRRRQRRAPLRSRARRAPTSIRVQRALNAAGSPHLTITGTYDAAHRATPSAPTSASVGHRRHQGRRVAHLGGPARRTALSAERWTAQARCRAASALVKNPSPSVPGPHRSSTACSGCGIRPTTLPASLVTPAIARCEPLGLPPT